MEKREPPHYVRDVAFAEHRFRARICNAPPMMACLHNFTIVSACLNSFSSYPHTRTSPE
jgi:hypothetical protein